MFSSKRPRRWLIIGLATLVMAALLTSRLSWRERAPAVVAAQAPVVGDPAVAMVETVVPAAASPAPALPSPAPGAIFAYVPRPAFAADFERQLPAPTQAVHYVQVDRAWVEGKKSPLWQKGGAGRFNVPLPDGRTLPVLLKGSEMLDADRSLSTGQVEGQPLSRVVVAWHRAGQMTMALEMVTLPDDARLHDYALRATGRGPAQFFEVDSALIPACPGVVVPQLDADAWRTMAARKQVAQAASETANPAEANGTTAAAVTNPPVTLDVMFLYTTAVYDSLQKSAAAFQTAADTAIQQINAAYTASQIRARVRLVKVAQVDYDETTSAADAVQNDALTALRKTADGKMDEIHALRDAAGADLVCLFHQRSDSGSAGLGYILTMPSQMLAGTYDQDNSLEPAMNDTYAFCVVQYGYVTYGNVVAHELGHNLGCQHDRENAGSTAGAFAYSYGYRFTGANGVQYRTIMAYSPGQRLAFFSNPEITAAAPISVALGIPAGQTGEADNAQTIGRDAFEVAAYRMQKQTAVGAGTLLAVSTRAYVGTDDKRMIAGFQVTGTQAKSMLIRAVGPTMMSAGVPDLLADPQLSLVRMSDGAQVAFNDDWQGAPNDPAVLTNTFMKQQGLSSLDSPKESALLLTLNPGLYTAVVSGVGNASGHAIVEVYEAGHTEVPKITALSTRGYAAKGREMIAGFAVHGVAGVTKRILIRVQGPTLEADAGVAGVMEDPFMELHAAGGTLIAAKDDWSSSLAFDGNTFTYAGTGNDFQPTHHLYSEQAVYATGFAPKNRREPAMLVDLEPGNYTVIVRPFEFLPDQPESPGVALVDVYEITR